MNWRLQLLTHATPLLLTCLAFFPNTNSMASITFDLPLPLGPTTDEKHCVGCSHARVVLRVRDVCAT